MRTLPFPEWSLARRFAFRAGCLYVILFALPFPLGAGLGSPLSALLEAPLPWFARVAFGIGELSLRPSGSGDRLADWVARAFGLTLAIAGAVIWSAISRRALHHRTALAGMRIYVRYFVGWTMLLYGFAKLFPPTQFPPPWGDSLVAARGDFSPMGLLWAFMGFSPAYVAFTGVAEVIGGALLLHRRTTTLGAIVVAAVMANVVALNFCYDVPVKIHSVHYLALAMFLAAPDTRRLFDVFVRGRATEAVAVAPRGRATRIVKGLVIASMALSILPSWQAQPAPAMEGAYSVEGDPSITRLGIGPYGFRVVHADGSGDGWYRATLDSSGTLVAQPFYGEPAREPPFRITALEDGRLRGSGNLDGAPITLTLTPQEIPLRSRGFRWVNEWPYNR